MNLNDNPSMNQLKNILASCDDQAGKHFVWVSHEGNVSIDLIPHDISFGEYLETINNHLQFRFPCYIQGNGYVGVDAANTNIWVSTLFNDLLHHWSNNSSGFQDSY